MPPTISALEDRSSLLDKGRAKISVSEDIAAMIQDWRARLEEARKRKKLSMRQLGLQSGMGEGYISSIVTDRKEPGIDSLIAVCETLGVGLTWLLYGFDIDPSTEQLLQILQESDPEDREALLKLLKNRAAK